MYRLFWPLVAAFIFTSCAPPLGYINDGGTAGEELLAVPYRIVYNVNNLFQRRSDVAVYTSSRGTVRSIPVKDVRISVIENPSSPNALTRIPDGADYPLENAGRKIIVLAYKGLEARYSIEVQDPLGIGGGGSGGGGGGIELGGGQGGIKWEY